MNENREKNIEKRIRNLKAGRLKTAPQPTPEQKKAGWDRRRQRQAIADKIMAFKNLPYVDVLKIRALVKKEYKTDADFKQIAELLGVATVTLEDIHMFTYAFSQEYIVDWIDRNLEKAPSKTEITGADGADLVNPFADLPLDAKLAIKEIMDKHRA